MAEAASHSAAGVASARPPAAVACSSSKKALPSLPFRVRVRYGSGPLPSSCDASVAGGLDGSSASSADLPVTPCFASLLRVDLVVLLKPNHRRSDVGALLSALKTLQADSGHLLGWRLCSVPERTVAGVAYPALRLSLWANSALSSNLQLVGLQRVTLARLPAGIARCFGKRDVDALIRAAVLSAYSAAGLPTVHQPTGAASASSARVSPPDEQHFAFDFPHTLGELLTAVQHLVQNASQQQLDELLPLFSAASSAASSSHTPPPSAPVSELASMAPSLPDLPPVEPLCFDARLPLLSQLSRGFSGVLSLLKKSAAFVAAIDVQRQDEPRMGGHAMQRHMLCEMQGCGFASFYAFLQHRLPLATPTPTTTHDAASTPSQTTPSAPLDSVAATSFLHRLRLLSPALQWLNDLVVPPLPPTPTTAEAAAQK